MRQHASARQISSVIDRVKENGLKTHVSQGESLTIIGCIGPSAKIEQLQHQPLTWEGVDRVERISKPWKLAGFELHPKPSVVRVGGNDGLPIVDIGGGEFTMMAGPCTVENRQMLFASAEAVKKAGAKILRGGAFKPRTSPYDFQGMGVDGLKLLQEAGREFGLPTITEVRSPAHIAPALKYCDMLQIGARNMQNYDLLREVGQAPKPVLLKRGLSATVKELLLAAEYILTEGNESVILCERGIRTFETATRFTMDVGAVASLREATHLPIVVDPSHAAGRFSLVAPIGLAGVAAGADGLIVEVHCNPKEAKCDGDQALVPERFRALMEAAIEIHRIVAAHRLATVSQKPKRKTARDSGA